MIGADRYMLTQVGKAESIQFDTDLPGDVVWAVHSDSPVKWLDFEDEAVGVASGTATADEGLFIVTATSGSDVDTASVEVEVVPAGFQARYADATAEAGTDILAVPRIFRGVAPIRWRPASLPDGLTVDADTGVVRGPMPEGGGRVDLIGVDATRATTGAVLRLQSLPRTFPVLFDGGRVRESGAQEVTFAANELVEAHLDTPGASPPLTAVLTAAPPWARVSDGDEVVLRGTTAGGEGGLVVVDVTDSEGTTGRWTTWVVVDPAPPLALYVPESITGLPGTRFPGELYARPEGGRSPYELGVEAAPTGVAISTVTRQITGSFPATDGEEQTARFYVFDDDETAAFADMRILASSGEFSIQQDAVGVGVSTAVSEQPTVVGGQVLPGSWSKVSGPTWLAVNATTGAITGTAPSSASKSVLRISATSTLGATATLDVEVTVTPGAMTCTLPAIAAERGTAGSVQITVTNAPGGWTASLTKGPPWIAVSRSGRVSWGALTDSDTSIAEIEITVTRLGDGATTACSRGPTIRNAPAVRCSIAGDDRIPAGASKEYRIAPTTGRASSWSMSATGATVTNLGGGRFRVTNSTAAGGTINLSGTVTVSGRTSGTCTKSVTSVAALTCTAPSPTFQFGGTASGSATSTGGHGAKTFAATGLPAGVSMSTAGSLMGGSTTARGTYSFTVTVTDADSVTATCSGTLTITGAAPVCAATPALSGRTGTSFSGQLPAPTNAAAAGPVVYSRATGPAWIVVDSDGSYRGTRPATPGPGTWSYRITGSGGACTGAAGAVTVSYPPLACRADSPSGFRGEPTFANIDVSGGSGRYSSVVLVSPAAGLSISGTTVRLAAQSADSSVDYTVRVTDSAGSFATCTGTFTISGTRPSS